MANSVVHAWSRKFGWAAVSALSLSAAIGCNGRSRSELPATQIIAALAQSSDPLPQHLEYTYLFQNGDPTKPRFGVAPYDVRSPLWSDGAHKQRYVFVPPAERITVDSASGALTYPIGTTFIKHFASAADGKTPVETRVVVLKSDEKWHFGTYVWQADGQAVLNDGAKTLEAGDHMTYRIPSETECRMCHGESNSPETVLGFVPSQLNFQDQEGQKNIAKLDAFDLFTSSEALLDAPLLPPPDDESLALDERVRSYLDINCGTCHRPGGAAESVGLDLRLRTAFADTGLVAKGKVKPGDPDGSILWRKVSTETEADRMPPVSLRADPLALALIKQWIANMPADTSGGEAN